MLRRTSPRNRVGRLLGITVFVAWMLTLASLLAPASCSQARDAEDGLFHWTITTVVEIDASPARVWRVLIDLPAYWEWNPFIVEASGTVAVGETLSLRMVLPGRDPMTIEPRLLVVEPERELRWKGRLLVPGLFDGEHVFALTPLVGGRTRLHHWERFGGFLLPIARPLIYEDTVRAFHALNAALAARASGSTSVGNGRSNSGGVRLGRA
jgi:hypothetical protein